MATPQNLMVLYYLAALGMRKGMSSGLAGYGILNLTGNLVLTLMATT